MIRVIEKNSVNIDVRPYLVTRGWTILSSNEAKHEEPNKGTLEFTNYNIQDGMEYEVSFTLKGMTGEVKVSLGGVDLETIEEEGYYQRTIQTVDNSNIKIYATGNVTVELFNIERKLTNDSVQELDTIAYSQPRGGWISFRSYSPEDSVDTFREMITFREGNLWIHSENAPHNNFYGKQYSTEVEFPLVSAQVQTFNSIALYSNKVMGTTEEGIVSELGNVTDLVNYDFNTQNGIHYANLLRDSLTGDLIKGRYIVVTLTDEETKGEKLQIYKVVAKSEYNSVNE